MKLQNLTRIVCLAGFAAFSTGAALAAEDARCVSPSVAQDWNFPSEATQLLKEIRSASIRLTNNATNLTSFAKVGVSWQTHAAELTSAREQVNTIGERIGRLQEIRHMTEPEQQAAIDRITPVGVSLAAHTQAAIQHLRDNQRFLWAGEYTSHLNALADDGDRVSKFVGLHLDLENTQNKLDTLRGQIDSLSI